TIASPNARVAGRGARSAFFPAMGAFVVFIAFVGFSRTFFLPLLGGTFTAPIIILILASLMFSWVFLFLTQTLFIRAGSFKWHRRLGIAGAALAALIVPFTIATGVAILPRDLANMGEGGYSAFLPTIIEALLFGSLVAGAISLRSRPDYHKRLMLLATLSALGPAWFRFRHFFPEVENPIVIFAFGFAIVPMLFAAVWDTGRNGRIHPVFLFILPGMLAIYVVEVWGSGHPWFIGAAKYVAALLG
ncbi:MAG: hypothetical protein RIE56_10370, partial [Amphiplicatus sp.]